MLKFALPKKCPFSNIVQKYSTGKLEHSTGYAKERSALEAALKKLIQTQEQVPVVCGEREIFTGDFHFQRMPHDHQSKIALFSYANRAHIQIAISQAMKMHPIWSSKLPEERAEVWLRCADILADSKRHRLTAGIMLGQSKTYRQAEDDIDRLINSIRLYTCKSKDLSQLKVNHKDAKVASHIRPLDGFIACMGPFNWTCESVGVILCPSLMGNCVLWRPSTHNVLSCYIVMKALKLAGLPPGVVNFLPGNGKLFVDTISQSPQLGGVNIASSQETFQNITSALAVRMQRFKHWPRISAMLGGKNFHLVEQSADVETAVDATIYGAFDYAGQHGISCERLYISKAVWPAFWCLMQEKLSRIRIGDVCDFSTDVSAVINQEAFDRVVGYMSYARDSESVELLSGGDFCRTYGYFIQPTVVLCKDPRDRLMIERVQGPLLSVYIYEDNNLDNTLTKIDGTSHYGLSGSIFSKNDEMLDHICQKLRMAASNIYVNAACTGSVDHYLPFSGSRMSGTNNISTPSSALMLWSSAQMIQKSLPTENCEK